MKKLAIVFGLLFSTAILAQQYAVDWHKIGAGGTTSKGSAYQVSGTIGQHDASGSMVGGNYSLTGGFWSFISVIQTAGAPMLTVTRSGSSVIVSWPSFARGFILQENSDLGASNWAPSGYVVSTNGALLSITITQPTGNLFFRLKQ